MRTQSDDINKLNSESSASLSERKSKVYQPPTVILLEGNKPEGGTSNVPETNNGVLAS